MASTTFWRGSVRSAVSPVTRYPTPNTSLLRLVRADSYSGTMARAEYLPEKCGTLVDLGLVAQQTDGAGREPYEASPRPYSNQREIHCVVPELNSH